MISVVVPVYNEEESLEAFYQRLKPVLSQLSKSHEIVFVDDGSRDRSLHILKELAKKDSTIRIFSFRRNQGKAEALTVGFQKAKGEKIVTLDADLQDKPEEIHKLLEKQSQGYDVVSGWRKDRKDKAKMKLISKLFNSMMGFIWGVRLHDYNCGLKLYTREAAKSLRLYGGMHRFIPLLVSEHGFSVTEVPVVHDVRHFGKSKYGFSKIFKDLPDMFTMLFLTKYGKRPLHFFGLVGGVFIAVGVLILLYFTAIHTLFHVAVTGRPSLYIGLLLVIAGFQIGLTGFLADLMIHIDHDVTGEEGLTMRLRYSTEKDKTVTV